MHGNGIALVFDEDAGNILQLLAEFGRRTFENGYRGGGRIVVVMAAIGTDHLEAVATGVPDLGKANPVPDVGQITAAQYCDRALRGKLLQCLGGSVDKGRRIRIRDYLGQRAVKVQAHERLSAVDDPDQLTIRVEGIRQLRHALVSGTDLHFGEVGNHHVGAVPQEVVGMPHPIDADDDREPAVTTRLHPRLGVLDDHAPLWSRAQSARRLQQDSRVGLADQPERFCDDAVYPDRKQVAESGRLQSVFAVAAR